MSEQPTLFDTEYIERSAVFSDCRTWRYTLERYWDKSKPFALFILLNPSTADEYKDDPTNRRGIRYANDWGYGGVVFCNLFAYRTPYPDELVELDFNTAHGPSNLSHIEMMCDTAGIIICAWGTNGGFLNQHEKMEGLLRAYNYDLYHLGLTKYGFPKHILYLKADLKPQLWADK